ncbi:hypothetical protein MCUN1_002760 [Malassezia cuniculi]|uniref:YTH domain-containing protein n=1 Tax=Malassezia cuniculi TaxID=948313 RepID=A0AAF0J6T2_9BASI|nr:hypothetical protein MCUN1_002760 [Malassezia cuniculi]
MALDLLRRQYGSQTQTRKHPDAFDDTWTPRPSELKPSRSPNASPWSGATALEEEGVDPLAKDSADPLASELSPTETVLNAHAHLANVTAASVPLVPVFTPGAPINATINQGVTQPVSGYTLPPTYAFPYNGYIPMPYPVPMHPPRAFVIKSFDDADVKKSLEHGIWTSTKRGNQRLDSAWHTSGSIVPIYLFFSVNGSGQFCGVARMASGVDYEAKTDIWSDGHWSGYFKVQWMLVKDVPNRLLRHIILTNTPEQKPVTQSRDTQEISPEAVGEMLNIMTRHPATSSLISSSPGQ